jgi:DNA repair exonuclease SbcCD ATPase subunit
MIKFSKLKYKNFLSAGANAIEIQLDASKSTLVVGHNGAGKSSMLDALSFALFGKPHRNVSKNQLINSVNLKGTEVSVEFNTAGHDFKIVRGIKPNNFEIWQDGSMIDQSASVRDYQKFLEQNILKLNHKSFHQIVVLGSSSFIPFMQLSTNHRREVIEDLLDINIFSKMKGILKERVSDTRGKSKDAKAELDVLKGKIQYLTSHITDMTAINQSQLDDHDTADAAIQSDIDKLTEEGIALSKEASTWPTVSKQQMQVLTNISKEFMSQAGEIKKSISNLTEEHLFYMNNDECPTCNQSISQFVKDERVRSIKASAKILLKDKETIDQDDQHNSDAIMELQVELDRLAAAQRKASSIQSSIEMLRGTKKADVKLVDLTDKESELSLFQIQADEYRDDLDELNEKSMYNDIAQELLKDSGIRTKVIREYLPAMNILINQYLQTLDFFVSFNLDESFTETIKSRHRDSFVYANFSEGEKMRIDLSLLFAWRKIAQMKNSTNTNLLILDETFDSSLDDDGVDNLMKILYSMGDDTNTFIISHKPDILESKLDAKLTFSKPNNFSQLL